MKKNRFGNSYGCSGCRIFNCLRRKWETGGKYGSIGFEKGNICSGLDA